MTMPFYASAEQIMRDRSEYARKGIARGRGVVACKFAGGVLFVAENPSGTLHKVGEIYDRIGFAAAGRYNEYENLRVAGVRFADVTGYSNSRRDVGARAIANAYSQTLGAIFTEQQKPYEVEICVAEVGRSEDTDQLYRLTYDGSITDETGFAVMGGQADIIGSALREAYRNQMEFADAIRAAVRALGSAGDGAPRQLDAAALEVAVLDRSRTGRTFRRLSTAAVAQLLTEPAAPPERSSEDGAAAGQPGATEESAAGQQGAADETSGAGSQPDGPQS